MAETGRNADALQQEIERTREELARTVDTIAERVSPRNVTQRTVQQLKDDAAAARKKLPSGGKTDFHQALAHRESESQESSGGSHRATGSVSSALGGVGGTLQANRMIAFIGVGFVVVVTVTVVTRRRHRG